MSRFREYLESNQGRSSSKGTYKGKSGVSLEGFDEFLLMVKKLPDSIKVSEMRKIIKTNLKPVAAAIKANTPIRNKTAYSGLIRKFNKDGDISTTSGPGNLRRSIGIKTFGNKGGDVTGYAGIQNGRKVEDYGGVGDGWYGFFRERGTKYQPKRPFIAPAAAASVPAAKERFEIDLKEHIVKSAKRLGLDAR